MEARKETVRTEARKAALAAGWLLLAMAAAAAFSYGYVHGNLISADDPEATWTNLTASSGLFRAELFGWLAILIADVAAAWALYAYLRPVHAELAVLGAWLRLIYAAILGAAVLRLSDVAVLVHAHGARASEVVRDRAMTALASFESAWSFGLVAFGGHLLVVGYLACRARGIPNVFGILLIAAGLSYVAVHLGKAFLAPDTGFAAALEAVLAVPMAVGELAFAAWLLLRGGKETAR